MKEFFKKNAFQILIGVIGLIGMAYVLNANVKTLIEDNKSLKSDVIELKTFKAVQHGENIYIREKLDRIDRNLERLIRRQ